MDELGSHLADSLSYSSNISCASSLGEIFQYVRTRGNGGEPEFPKEYLKTAPKGGTQELICAAIDSIVNALTKSSRSELLVVGRRFDNLYAGLRRHSSVKFVETGTLCAFRRLLRDRNVNSIAPAKRALLKIYRSGHVDLGKVEKIVRNLAAMIRRSGAKAVILENDSLFAERAIILAARSQGIPTFTIQHGIFQAAAAGHVPDGQYCDVMLTWGEYFRDMLIKRGVSSAQRVLVLGYPHGVVKAQSQITSDAQNRICFLGQPWGRYLLDLDKAQIGIVRNLKELAANTGLSLVYRPHPGENRRHIRRSVDGIRLTPRKQSLQDAIATYGVFASITSTALIQAGLSGKIAIQIFDKRFMSDDFGAIGACHSVSSAVSDLRNVLAVVAANGLSPRSVDPNYIQIPRDPARKLIGIMKQFGAVL